LTWLHLVLWSLATGTTPVRCFRHLGAFAAALAGVMPCLSPCRCTRFRGHAPCLGSRRTGCRFPQTWRVLTMASPGARGSHEQETPDGDHATLLRVGLHRKRSQIFCAGCHCHRPLVSLELG
jgi:hypothetical protein